MPYLTGPEPRHSGQAVKTIERRSQSITIGLVYDPSRVSPPTIDREFEATITESIRDAALRARLTIHGQVSWDGWDAVDRLTARYPGDVIRHPGLDPRPAQDRRHWYPTEAERRELKATELRRAKARHIAETGDWAVDGEGAG